MDEKVGQNPNHKCVCKDTHPGMGPHRDCQKRRYHLCGCGKRSHLADPDRWIARDEAMSGFFAGLEAEIRGASAEAEDMLHRSSSDDIDKFIASGFLQFLGSMIETPLDAVIRSINEAPPHLHESEPHFHVYHHSRRGKFHGQMHLCLDRRLDEDEAAKYAANLIIEAKITQCDLIHVGGGEPAYHAAHVEMDDSPLMGVHIDPIRRN